MREPQDTRPEGYNPQRKPQYGRIKPIIVILMYFVVFFFFKIMEVLG